MAEAGLMSASGSFLIGGLMAINPIALIGGLFALLLGGFIANIFAGFKARLLADISGHYWQLGVDARSPIQEKLGQGFNLPTKFFGKKIDSFYRFLSTDAAGGTRYRGYQLSSFVKNIFYSVYNIHAEQDKEKQNRNLEKTKSFDITHITPHFPYQDSIFERFDNWFVYDLLVGKKPKNSNMDQDIKHISTFNDTQKVIQTAQSKLLNLLFQEANVDRSDSQGGLPARDHPDYKDGKSCMNDKVLIENDYCLLSLVVSHDIPESNLFAGDKLHSVY